MFRSSKTLSISLAFLLQIGLYASLLAQDSQTKRGEDKLKMTQEVIQSKTLDNISTLTQMSTEQRDKIVAPKEGMVIYNTSTKKPQFYNGFAWKYFDSNRLHIGQEFAGGVIFYIDASGEHGLVVSIVDQDTAAKWGFFETPAGATDRKFGAGQSNTEKIIAKGDMPHTAARICSDLNLEGFNDWFLPSIEELVLVYQNLKAKGLCEFADARYWSSSETDFNNAWLMDYKTGTPIESNVDRPTRVRAIRKF